MSNDIELKPEVGKGYKWKYQPERLVYTGQEGPWHQFELVSDPGTVWCEVLDSDLSGIEETPELNTRPPSAPISPVVTDGMVSVPREPTEEMLIAGWGPLLANFRKATNRYNALVAAAPTQDNREIQRINDHDLLGNRMSEMPDSPSVMVGVEKFKRWLGYLNAGEYEKKVIATEDMERLFKQAQ